MIVLNKPHYFSQVPLKKLVEKTQKVLDQFL